MRPALPILLLMLTALAGCSSGNDSDGDGVSNELELDGWATHTVDLMDRRIHVLMTSDPDLVDTDGDGLTDHQELLARTNPRSSDTDQDGLTDCQELFHTNATECEDPAFDASVDGDGGYPTDPRNADSDPGPTRYKPTLPFVDETGTLPVGGFQFGDGVSDGDEILGYEVDVGGRMVRVTTDPRLDDSDDDGLEDGEEVAYGGNPTVADSDGDGCLDGEDPWPGQQVTYRATLHEIRLTSPQYDAVELDLYLNFASKVAQLIDGLALTHNETVSVEQSVVHPDRCRLAPYAAWDRIQIVALDAESGAALDVLGGGQDALEWHVRDEVIREEGSAVSISARQVEREGDDLTVVFSMAVIPPA